MILRTGIAPTWSYNNSSASPIDGINISSGTDNGTGDFTHNFTSSFANTIYSISAHCHYTTAGTTAGIFYNGHAGVERTASAIEMESYYVDNTNPRSKLDMDDCDLICFGDLA